MDWFATIKRMFDRSLWTKQQVADGVYAGKITAAHYTQITSEEYVVPKVTPFSEEILL